jgi:hypothetical protein
LEPILENLGDKNPDNFDPDGGIGNNLSQLRSFFDPRDPQDFNALKISISTEMLVTTESNSSQKLVHKGIFKQS